MGHVALVLPWNSGSLCGDVSGVGSGYYSGRSDFYLPHLQLSFRRSLQAKFFFHGARFSWLGSRLGSSGFDCWVGG